MNLKKGRKELSVIERPALSDEESEKAPDGVHEDAAKLSRAVKIGLTALTLVLLAVTVLLGLQARQDAAEADRRDTAIAVARERVLQLTTLSYTDIDHQLEVLLDGTTGEFRRQFQGTLGTFAQVVRQGKVEATGEIAEAGVVRIDDDTARVLVAATAMVRNTESKKTQPRQYRLAVDLQRDGGTWLVSGMEFVP